MLAFSAASAGTRHCSRRIPTALGSKGGVQPFPNCWATGLGRRGHPSIQFFYAFQHAPAFVGETLIEAVTITVIGLRHTLTSVASMSVHFLGLVNVI